MQKPVRKLLLLFTLIIGVSGGKEANSQMITGTWKGKINRQKVEVKIIQQGDSLTGTSYYYESPNNYRRYSIIGYFDANTNEAVWWDDKLLEEKSTRFSISIPGKIPMLSRADFNCPGGSRMMLDGKVAAKENERNIKGEVHMDKTYQSDFEDEWDFVIDNFTSGTNDPDIIDSVKNIAYQKNLPVENSLKSAKQEKPTVQPAPVLVTKTKNDPPVKTKIPKEEVSPVVKIAEPIKAPTIEDKFITRTKNFIKEIQISGDSIELRFYDNAEIDGDSISLFLNGKLLFQHITAYGKSICF